MIFLVVILSSVIGYFTYAINLVEQVNDQVIMKGIESFDKSRENFEIVNIRIDGGKFNFTIQNTGELPMNVTRLWVSNIVLLNLSGTVSGSAINLKSSFS